MPTNDFEKQVQVKMDELRFEPSGAVWEELEKQLGRRKKRRVLVWWWLLPFLAAGSLLAYRSYRLQPHAVPPVATQAGSAVPTAPAAPAQEGNLSGHTLYTPLYAPQNKEYDKTTVKRQRPLAPGNGAEKITTGIAAVTGQLQNQVQYQLQTQYDNPAPVSLPGGEGAGALFLRPAVVTRLPGDWYAGRPVPPASGTGLVKPSKTKKRMDWVLSVHTGEAGLSSGLLPLPQSTAPQDITYAASPSGAVIGGSYSANVSRRPASIKPGFSAGLGLSLRSYLSADGTFSLEAGLLYSYHNTFLLVGKRVDSAWSLQSAIRPAGSIYSNYAYTGTDNSYYRNHYHYVEIPVRVAKQLGYGSAFSVQAGISIGRLLAADALQYDAGSNVFYKDAGNLQKTQVSLLAGADIRLWRYRPVSVEVGPRLQYGLTRFQHDNTYGSKHLLFAGLETRILFKKR